MVFSLAPTHLLPRLLIHLPYAFRYRVQSLLPFSGLPIDAHHHISVYYAYTDIAHISVYYAYTDIAMETANAEAMGYVFWYACSVNG